MVKNRLIYYLFGKGLVKGLFILLNQKKAFARMHTEQTTTYFYEICSLGGECYGIFNVPDRWDFCNFRRRFINRNHYLSRNRTCTED